MSKSNPLAVALPPKSSTAAFAEITKIINMGWVDIPPEKAFNGNAAPGDYLEHLLGGKKNNRDSPDLQDWELVGRPGEGHEIVVKDKIFKIDEIRT